MGLCLNFLLWLNIILSNQLQQPQHCSGPSYRIPDPVLSRSSYSLRNFSKRNKSHSPLNLRAPLTPARYSPPTHIHTYIHTNQDFEGSHINFGQGKIHPLHRIVHFPLLDSHTLGTQPITLLFLSPNFSHYSHCFSLNIYSLQGSSKSFTESPHSPNSKVQPKASWKDLSNDFCYLSSLKFALCN